MRAICCAILAYIFYVLFNGKAEVGIFANKTDKLFMVLWGTLCYISLIAAIVLCILGL